MPDAPLPKPGKILTQRAIAERCGLKQSAVSFALRGDERHVSPETIARVRAVAAELGYTANHAAQRMIAGRFGTSVLNRLIAVCLQPGFHHDPYFLEPYLGVMDTLEAANFDMLVMTGEAGRDKKFLPKSPALARGDVDALIVFNIQANIERLLEQARAFPTFAERPFVSLIHPVTECSTVMYDDAQAYEDIATHLLQLGHRHLLILVAPYGDAIWQRRQAGLRRAYARHGLNPTPHLHCLNMANSWYIVEQRAAASLSLYTGLWYKQEGETTLPHFLRAHPEITGIVAWNDVSAQNAWRIVEESGRQVPAEISITGFDDADVLLDAEGRKRLTTIHLPAHQLGQEAARLAIARVTGEIAEDRQLCFPGELIVRASTAPPTIPGK